MHNRNVLETTGAHERVEELTSNQIQKLDAAFRWRQPGNVFPPGAELGVPKLEDVLEIKELRDTRMNIEIKPFLLPIELIKKFGNLLREYEVTKNVLVASGCRMNLFFFRREYPEVATSASVPELLSFRALKSVGYKPNCDALQLSSKAGPLHFITREYVEKAHSYGLKVHGWTVNEPEEMGRLIPLGVDGIITDYPTTLLKFLGRPSYGIIPVKSSPPRSSGVTSSRA
ncbi:MAG TPA: glycerophosphodiester phosphodiesterase family protein, partial [Pyrinomonadaceae bacterium]